MKLKTYTMTYTYPKTNKAGLRPFMPAKCVPGIELPFLEDFPNLSMHFNNNGQNYNASAVTLTTTTAQGKAHIILKGAQKALYPPESILILVFSDDQIQTSGQVLAKKPTPHPYRYLIQLEENQYIQVGNQRNIWRILADRDWFECVYNPLDD